MTGATTEHAQVVVEAALSFLQGQLSVFAKLVGDGCGVSGGGLRFVGLLVFVKLVVLVAVVGFVAFIVGFVVIVVRLVLSGMGFFAEAFPMMGVDVMCKGFHFSECQRLPLLTHNVFNAFGESRIVVVPEDTFIPAGVDSEMVEFDVILYNMLVIMHFEVIDSVFSISSGVWTKLGQSSSQSGISSESRRDGSKNSKVVPRRWESMKVTLLESSE